MTAGEFGRTVRVLLAWFCAPPCEKCRNYRGRSTERLHWRISSTSHYVYTEYSLAYDTWWYLNKNVFAITYRISSGERGEENGPSVYTDMFTIRYFRVTYCLCVKMSLHMKMCSAYRFILMEIKFTFIRKVLLEDSFERKEQPMVHQKCLKSLW